MPDLLPDFLKNVFPLVQQQYDNAYNTMMSAGQATEQNISNVLQGNWRADADSVLLNLYDELANVLKTIDPSGKNYGGLLQQFQTAIQNGDYKTIQGLLSSLPSGFKFNGGADYEKWLDNMISTQNTEAAQQYEEYMRDTSVTSTAQQLQSLGLSSSGVLQSGFASSGTVGAADNVKSNIKQQQYAQRMSLARQLLSMTSSMASAGIYGGALAQAKKASSVLTSGAAHSALALQNQLNDLRYAELQKTPGWKEYY